MINFGIHIFLLLTTVLSANVANAERIPSELVENIQSKAKQLYAGKGAGHRGDECIWDYLTRDNEYFDIYNQVYKFGETSFYAFGCSYGAYNFWQVWLREEQNGDFTPIYFEYPEIEYYSSVDSDRMDRSRVVRMTTVGSLCNTTIDETEWTIRTDCKSRGLGDINSTGFWKYIDDEFVLQYYDDDNTLDLKQNPIRIYFNATGKRYSDIFED
jgi:hypothetical protein